MQLMVKKCEVIERTDPLLQLLTDVKRSPPGDIVALRSDQYLAVGCDLYELETLNSVMNSELDLDNCLVLCTAEVSLTYMDFGAADALIRWAATFKDGKTNGGLAL